MLHNMPWFKTCRISYFRYLMLSAIKSRDPTYMGAGFDNFHSVMHV